jgi:hypothetical protein
MRRPLLNRSSSSDDMSDDEGKSDDEDANNGRHIPMRPLSRVVLSGSNAKTTTATNRFNLPLSLYQPPVLHESKENQESDYLSDSTLSSSSSSSSSSIPEPPSDQPALHVDSSPVTPKAKPPGSRARILHIMVRLLWLFYLDVATRTLTAFSCESQPEKSVVDQGYLSPSAILRSMTFRYR